MGNTHRAIGLRSQPDIPSQMRSDVIGGRYTRATSLAEHIASHRSDRTRSTMQKSAPHPT